MKLSKIALSVVAVVGIAQVGGAWYTGKQVEQRYQELVTQANKSLKKAEMYGVHIALEEVKVERHLFSSDVNYNLVITTPSNETYKLKGDEKLNHGPLPLNRLVKGKLLPVMASVEGKLHSPENLKSIFKDDIVLTENTDIDYSQNISGTVTTNPAKSDDFEAKETETEFDFNNKNNVGDISTKIKYLSFTNLNSVKGIFKDVEYKFNATDLKYPNLKLGDTVLNIKELQITDPSNKIIFIKDLKATGESKLEKETVDSNAKIKMDLVMQRNDITQDFGEITLNADLIGDAETWDKALGTPDDLSNQELANQILLDALSKGFSFKIDELSLKNRQGKGKVKLDLNVIPFDPALIQSQGDILSILKKSKLDFKVDLQALQLMMKQQALLDNMTEQDADDFAASAITGLISDAKNSELAVVDDKNIKVKVAIDNGKVMLNDRELSEQEIQQFLFIIAFGLMGGMGH